MQLTISSIPKNIAQVEQYLKSLFNSHELDTDLYADILVSLTEAVNNAIIHGNQLDGTKEVCIESRVGSAEVRFVISDQGPGFDPTDITDPRHCSQQIIEEGGRGIMLMRALTRDISFYDGGSTVVLTFAI